MNQRLTGSMVSYMRTKKKISMELLSRGLCSTSALQRLEYGERLLERIGISVNKMEFLSEEAAIRECEMAFGITRGEMAYERLEEVVLSRMEAMIINCGCRYY